MSTHTNKPEKCPHCGADFNGVEWGCGTTPIIDGDTHRSPLCRERETRQNLEAELAITKKQLETTFGCLDADLVHHKRVVKAESENAKLRSIINEIKDGLKKNNETGAFNKTLKAIDDELALAGIVDLKTATTPTQDVNVSAIPCKAPTCKNCNSNTQVWRDEDWGNAWVCHRYGCGKPL